MFVVVELAFGEGEERLQRRPHHRELLTRLYDEGLVKMAGPFEDESGAMIVFEVPDLGTVDEIMAEDPYYTADGVTVVHRRPWTPIVGGGA